MSEPSAPPPLPSSPPPSLDGCLTALMIGAGILLLLPGLCAVLVISSDPQHNLSNQTFMTICLGFFAIAAVGIALIWAAVRRPRP